MRPNPSDTHVLILAGGKGSRSENPKIPKIMQEIYKNKTLLDIHIAQLHKHDFKNITFLLGYGADKVIKEITRISFKYPSLKIDWKVEAAQNGTNQPVVEFVNNSSSKNFLIILGDIAIVADYSQLLSRALHESTGLSIVVHPNLHPWDSDIVILNRESMVIDYQTKNTFKTNYWDTPTKSLAGVVIASNKRIKGLKSIDNDLMGNLLQKEEISKGILGINSSYYFHDTGTIERLNRVRNDFQTGVAIRRGSFNRAAIFLDRDGTLFPDIGTQRDRVKSDEIASDLADGIREANNSGIPVFIVTNQPGVAKGQIREDIPNKVQAEIESKLLEFKAFIDDFEYCPHHPDKGFEGELEEFKIRCECRKPEIGMFKKLFSNHQITPLKSYYLGDTEVDYEASKNAKLNFIKVDLEGEKGLPTHLGLKMALERIKNDNF